MMRAVRCKSFGDTDDLLVEEVSIPQITEDEVLIHVKYSGINFPDVLIVQGRYQFKPELPFTPGGEVFGEVVKVGHLVKHLKPGDRVVAAMGWGGFAAFAVAKGSNTYQVPEGVSGHKAAILLETYGTALYALKDRAVLKSGERLLVLGAAGGTGTAAIQLGKLFGAEVIAIASTREKRAFAEKQGAIRSFSPTEMKDAVKEMGGANVIFDPVGGNLSEEAFRTLKPGGRHLVVGFASGEIPAIPFNLPLLKSASIVGVFWGYFWRNESAANRKNVQLLLKWLQTEHINPEIMCTYPLQKVSVALKDLQDRKVQGKILLEVD